MTVTPKTSAMLFIDMSMSMRCRPFSVSSMCVPAMDSLTPSMTGRASVMSVQIAATPIAPAPMRRTFC